MRRDLRWTLVRAAAAAVLLVLAFRQALPAQGEEALSAVLSAWVAPLPVALLWFALACAIFLCAFVSVAARFRLLLAGAGLEAPFPNLVRGYVVANFLALVLPSALITDAYRLTDTKRDTGRGIEVATVVVVERVLALAALGTIVLLAAPFARLGAEAGDWVPRALVAAGALVAASGLLLHPRAARLARAALRPLVRLSPSLGDALDRAVSAAAQISDRPGAVAGAFGWSLLAQALPVAAVAVLAQPLDAQVPWHAFAVVVPIVTLVTLLPVSIGGAGVRELLFVQLFASWGVRGEVALALSLSVFAVTLVWGAVGFALFAADRSRVAAPGTAP